MYKCEDMNEEDHKHFVNMCMDMTSHLMLLTSMYTDRVQVSVYVEMIKMVADRQERPKDAMQNAISLLKTKLVK